MNAAKEAIVLKVGDRFFAYYRNKRVQTAWSLAGAKMFFDDWGVTEAEKILTAKNKKSVRCLVRLVEEKVNDDND